jgi:Fis1 N-terminal tetratricopeptide repeat
MLPTLNYHYLTMSSKFVIPSFFPAITDPVCHRKVLRLQYQKEQAQSHITVQTKFNYAWGLVKSPMREHQSEGVRLLQGASM